MLRINSAIFTLVLLSSAPASGDESPPIAGRTIEDYAAQLTNASQGDARGTVTTGDGGRIARLRAIKSLGAFGVAAGDVLRESLDHEDAAVRYVAAVHLGRIGGSPLEKAEPRLKELAADETSLAVQLAASYGLCCAGSIDQHLPLLIRTLEYPERGTACSAAELLGKIGPSAGAAIEPLEAAYAKHRPGAKGGDYHIGGAAINALRKIRAPQN